MGRQASRRGGGSQSRRVNASASDLPHTRPDIVRRGAMLGRLGALLCGLLLLAGCAGGMRYTSDADGAAAAWDSAWIILPGQQEPRRLADAGDELAKHPGARLPVVLFAHACGGFDAEAMETFRDLA